MPHSRRALLRAAGSSLAAGLAGCATGAPPGGDLTVTPAPVPTGTATPAARSPAGRPGARDDADVGIRSRSAATHRLTLVVEDPATGETVFRNVYVVDNRGGMAARGTDEALEDDRRYRVTAWLESGPVVTHAWDLRGALGPLTVVITEDGGLDLRQHVDCSPACEPASRGGSAVDLPYAVEGAPETFTPGSAGIRSDHDEPVDLTLEVDHDGTTVLAYTYRVTPERVLSIGPLVETAGTFDVVARTAAGARARYTWAVPSSDNYPSLSVLVREDGTPLVGCGWVDRTNVRVRNTTTAERDLRFELERDGEVVSTVDRSVPPETEAGVAVPVPIGGTYTLQVRTLPGPSHPARTAETAVRVCSCLGDEARLTVGESVFRLDTERWVCV